jgi:hypothetical protein
MLKINRTRFDENPIEGIEIISHGDWVIRRIWIMDNGVTLLDETVEYDEKGNELSSIFMDTHHNLIGFSERKYDDSSKKLLSRIEYDKHGHQLHKFQYIYDEDGVLSKVEVYSHEKLVRYALITHPDMGINEEDCESEWFDADDQQSDIPFKLDDVFSLAKQRYVIDTGGVI